MKLFLALFILSTAVFAQNLPSDQIQGAWKAKHPIYAKEAQLFMFFDFQKDNMTVAGTCLYTDKSTLQVSVNVKVAYLGSDIYIQESKESKIEQGYKFCRVYLTHTKWQFYFNASGEAVLVAAVPYGMQFQLAR